MKISFPSKLTDYTATGLPLLIHAPAYSSAVRWARAEHDVAEIVDEPGEAPLRAAIDAPARRRRSASATGRPMRLRPDSVTLIRPPRAQR